MITPHSDGVYLVTDGDRLTILLHPDMRTVTSLQGADGQLPLGYSFGCREDVFVGTLH